MDVSLGVLARQRLQLDFNVSFTEEQQRKGDVEHNYRKGNVSSREAVPDAAMRIAASVGTDWPTFSRDAPGMSAFVLEEDAVYHTYSAYERGFDALWGMYQWLDRAPKGRNETGLWWPR